VGGLYRTQPLGGHDRVAQWGFYGPYVQECITENIDTSTATGQLVFHIFGALAEFERYLIKERTIAGLPVPRAVAARHEHAFRRRVVRHERSYRARFAYRVPVAQNLRFPRQNPLLFP
jgi:hypothetical protein